MQPLVVQKMVNRLTQSLIDNQYRVIPMIGGKYTFICWKYMILKIKDFDFSNEKLELNDQ